MRGMESDIRLLVHAGARSNRTADDGFVCQARAYSLLVGQSTERQFVGRLQPAEALENEANQVPTYRLVEDEVTEPHLEASSFIEDTQLAHSALESQLYSSAAVAEKLSPRGKRRALEHAGTPPGINEAINASASNRREEPVRSQSHLSQSSYLVTPILNRTSQWVPPDYGPSPGHCARSQEQNGQSVQVLETAAELTLAKEVRANEDRYDASEEATCGTGETTSELPTSYSLSDIPAGNLEKRPQLSERSGSDPGTVTLLSNERTCAADTTRARRITQDHLMSARVGRLDPEPAVHASPRRQATAVASLETIADLPLSIRPPEADVAVGRFTTHVTEILHQLDTTPDIADRYKPSLISRDIDALERGYWLVPCSAWPIDQQVSFWKMLGKLIGGGSAGWGVWCSRGPELQVADQTAVKASSTIASSEFGPVRVYCWGEVARHVYLLLYVASNSRVRRSGLTWIDSHRQAIIRMPSTKE